jgi:hypothetical protein
MRPSAAVWGGDFKFQDYYSIYGFEQAIPFDLRPDTSEAQVSALAAPYERPGLEQIKQSLLDAFPFKC